MGTGCKGKVNVLMVSFKTSCLWTMSVALRVKVLQIESECSQFNPTRHSTVIWLSHSQIWSSHYQKESPTTSMLSLHFLRFWPKGHQETCNDLTLLWGSHWHQVKTVSMQRLISSEAEPSIMAKSWSWGGQIAVKKDPGNYRQKEKEGMRKI